MTTLAMDDAIAKARERARLGTMLTTLYIVLSVVLIGWALVPTVPTPEPPGDYPLALQTKVGWIAIREDGGVVLPAGVTNDVAAREFWKAVEAAGWCGGAK